jgi:glycosyltransferase involved in cell wall biosynthesis
VGLSLHDTGVSGRRGTVAAMLATGVPVVTARGVETDAWWDGCKGVEMPTHADRVDAEALADGVLRLLDESPVVMRQRREAAHAFYLRYASWAALSRALG